VQVVSKPNDSVIYKSYTGKLSTTMEARRSRLERMQTLPNIKLISPTSSLSRSVLDATPEVPALDDAPSTQPQRRRLGKTTSSLVKRMSEGRFFLTDRTRTSRTRTSSPDVRTRTSSPVFRRSPLIVTPTLVRPTSTGSETDQSEPLQTATEQRGGDDDEGRRGLKVVDDDDVDSDQAAMAGDGGKDRSVEGELRTEAAAPSVDCMSAD